MLKNRFDYEVMISFKIHDVTNWLTNICNTHIAQYLTRQRQPDMKFGQLIEYNKKNIVFQKSYKT